jgi:hypothetical protein
MLVAIDESGDPGFRVADGSSPFFVAVMVIFRDPKEAAACSRAIRDLVPRKGYDEFKFSKCHPAVRDEFFRLVKRFDFTVRAIVVEKSKIYSPRLKNNKEAFYQYFVKCMVKNNDGSVEGARILIDGSGERRFRQELKAHLRRHCPRGTIKDLRFKDSVSDPLVQLADMCAGAIARAQRPERKQNDRWLKAIKPKVDDVWKFE